MEVDSECKRTFHERRVATDVAADTLVKNGRVIYPNQWGDETRFSREARCPAPWPGLLLLRKGHSCHRPRRAGESEHRSDQGSTVHANLSVLSLVIVKNGEKGTPGLTDTMVPHCLGPRRVSRIRKLSSVSKEDDVCLYVVRKPLNKEESRTECQDPVSRYSTRPAAPTPACCSEQTAH